jgi:hypothetical protein
VWQSFLYIFPHLSGGTMATSHTSCHLPGEMLNSAAEYANRARIGPTRNQTLASSSAYRLRHPLWAVVYEKLLRIALQVSWAASNFRVCVKETPQAAAEREFVPQWKICITRHAIMMTTIPPDQMKKWHEMLLLSKYYIQPFDPFLQPIIGHTAPLSRFDITEGVAIYEQKKSRWHIFNSFLHSAWQRSCRRRPRKSYLTLPLPLPCPTLLNDGR